MQITVILVELLVIGGEFVLLLLLLGHLYFGLQLPPSLENPELESLIAMGLALYPLGIFWSRLSDAVVKPLDHRLKLRQFSSNVEYHQVLLRVLMHGGPAAEALAQVRSQYRLARATGVTCLFALLLFLPKIDSSALQPVLQGAQVLIASLLALVGLGSLLAWGHLRNHYLLYVRNAHCLVREGSASGESTPSAISVPRSEVPPDQLPVAEP